MCVFYFEKRFENLQYNKYLLNDFSYLNLSVLRNQWLYTYLKIRLKKRV